MDTTCPELLKTLTLGQNQDGWNSFVRIYHKSIIRWAREAGANEAEVDDITQETFLTVFQHIGDFERRKTGAFRSWIKTIIQLLVRHHHYTRKTTRWKHFDFDTVEIAEEDPARDQFDRKELVHQAIRMLKTEFKQQSWEVFELVYIQEKTPQQAAQIAGVSVNSVYISTSRIIARLRVLVDEFIDSI